MRIPAKYHEAIKRLDVNEFPVTCDYDRWFRVMPRNTTEGRMLLHVQEALSDRFNRQRVVEFFQTETDEHTKFLASMIWGYEAPEGSSASERGPKRVPKMMKSLAKDKGIDPLAGISVSDEKGIKKYYKRYESIVECGPNFFTKYLYFKGKSVDELRSTKKNYYPLIYDDRVAAAFIKIAVDPINNPNSIHPHPLKLVTAHARPATYAYLNYMQFAVQQASIIDCHLDNIEYFMFRHQYWDDILSPSGN